MNAKRRLAAVTAAAMLVTVATTLAGASRFRRQVIQSGTDAAIETHGAGRANLEAARDVLAAARV